MALVVLFAAGCADDNDGAAAGMTKVVAGFYPLAEATSRVGGERVSVTNLTPAGSEPHDLELTPDDVNAIEDAAVVVYVGSGFQPAVEEATGRAKGEALDVLSTDLGLITGYENEEGEKGTDPHVWLDPTLMKRIVEQVRTALVEKDPANRASYEAGAAAYVQELEVLDAAYRSGLAQCDRRTIVTSHAAFGYLARRYGLTQEAIAGLDPESEPDPNRLAELATKVKSDGITTIFSETLVSPRVAETLAREAGVKTAVLNPIEGLSDDERRLGASYLSVMRDNLGVLRAALGCH